jgi:hypothetical protein
MSALGPENGPTPGRAAGQAGDADAAGRSRRWVGVVPVDLLPSPGTAPGPPSRAERRPASLLRSRGQQHQVAGTQPAPMAQRRGDHDVSPGRPCREDRGGHPRSWRGVDARESGRSSEMNFDRPEVRPGSPSGCRRRQTPSDAGRRNETFEQLDVHIRRQQATARDGKNAFYKRGAQARNLLRQPTQVRALCEHSPGPEGPQRPGVPAKPAHARQHAEQAGRKRHEQNAVHHPPSRSPGSAVRRRRAAS